MAVGNVGFVVLHRVCPGCRRRRGAVCDRCLSSVDPIGAIVGLPGLDHAAALFRYDQTVQRIVVAAKNGGRRDALAQFGRLLVALVACEPSTVVTWVPASRAGRRRRGYDQGEILAGVVAAERGLDAQRLLVRRRGRSQSGRDRAQRLDGPSFRSATAGGTPPPESVLLVDDVITTGASMAAAAGALRESGVRSVTGIAVAWSATQAEAAAGTAAQSPRRLPRAVAANR